MSDKEELFETKGETNEEGGEGSPLPKLKPKRSRKPLSDERKQQLREQLAKAREQSAIKRGERALAKRLEKEENDDDVKNKLKKYAKKKGIITDDNNVDELKEQIANLKKQLESKGQPKTETKTETKVENNDDDIKKELKEMRLALKVMREQNKKEKEVKEEPKVESKGGVGSPHIPAPTPVSLNNKYRRKKRWIKD